MAVPMRPLSCAEAKQEAARRLFEPLEPHVEATLSAHLAICDECRRASEDQALAAHLLETSLLRADPPPGLERSLIEAAREPPAIPGRSVRRLLAATAA